MKAIIELFDKENKLVQTKHQIIKTVPTKGDMLFLSKDEYYFVVGVIYNKTFDEVLIEANVLPNPIKDYCERVIGLFYGKKSGKAKK